MPCLGHAEFAVIGADTHVGAGAKLEVLEEQDGLKLRVVRSVATADVAGLAGMVQAPARGVPRRLADFDPASLVTRARRGPP